MLFGVNDSSTSDYKKGEDFFTTRWPLHRKLQLITNEVRAKLKQAIEDGKELKFRIDSEEQSKELQLFLFECGYSWNDGKVCNTDAYCLTIHKYDKTIGFDLSESIFTTLEYLEFNLETGEIIEPEKEWVDVEVNWINSSAKIKLPSGIYIIGSIDINDYPIFHPFGEYMFIGYVFEGDPKDSRAHCHPVTINDNKIVEKATHARFIKVK